MKECESIACLDFFPLDDSIYVIVFQASLANDYTASVNRVRWSPDGNLVGMFE